MKISVYITSYNQKEFLKEAIESVLAQTLRSSQIIIIDDFSADGSQDLIRHYALLYPQKITPIYHSRNLGVSQTRIDALNAVTGDYVSYVDGDDRFLPEKLEKEAKTLKGNQHIQIAFSNNYYITKDDIRIGKWVENEAPPEGDVFIQTFARDYPKKSLFRMELINYKALEAIGFHDPRLNIYEDFDLRIRVTKKLKTAYYNQPLSEIRQHDNGLSKLVQDEHLNLLRFIYRKNQALLSDLNTEDKKHIKKEFYNWMAKIAKSGAYSTLEKNSNNMWNKLKALTFFLKALKYDQSSIDAKLIIKLIKPW